MEISEREKFIILVDNDIIKKSDAIILLEGDGLNRCKQAVKLYKNKFSNKIVFSGGITDHNYGSLPADFVLPELNKLGVKLDDIIIEDKSQNTREQAEEVIKIALKNNWIKIILVASHNHQFRAFLTFLKVINELKYNLIIYNAPVKELKWFSNDGYGTRIDQLESEFVRIEKYRKTGHLETFEEGIKYQQWKELQT
jgi:uncharacterized SAM-binding protein YcdF (DUF218 family)